MLWLLFSLLLSKTCTLKTESMEWYKDLNKDATYTYVLIGDYEIDDYKFDKIIMQLTYRILYLPSISVKIGDKDFVSCKLIDYLGTSTQHFIELTVLDCYCSTKDKLYKSLYRIEGDKLYKIPRYYR